MSFAVVFPGQGSQAVGMLQALAAEHAVVGETFDQASAVLEYDLWTLVRQGPAKALNATTKTQPALLAAGVAVWRVWCAEGGALPAFMAGHSLGEYAALVAAGALDFNTAIGLAAFRGESMQAAVPVGRGAMAAILGLDAAAVEQACDQAGRCGAAGHDETVEVANFNAPGQVVISGYAAAVERAIEMARSAGAKRAVLLPVSVPSHCSLMKPVAEKLGDRLAGMEFKPPKFSVIHNVDVAEHGTPDEIRHALTAQLDRPVRWAETVRHLVEQGVTRLIEMGPGRVLTGLGKRIERRLECLPANDPESLQTALAAVRDCNA